jgi:hypothetical protein
MDEPSPEPQIDARSARFELGALAVILLAGYVFGIIWVIPAVAALLAVGLGFGRKANLLDQLFQVLVADRLKPAAATESESTVRFSELFAVVVLTISTLLYVVGVSPLAWLVALLEAGACALQATTGISIEGAVRRRFTGRRRHQP